MKHDRLEDMVKGWFVGNFKPSAFPTDACEASVKRYQAGDSDHAHYHKIATEITLILSGEVRMLDRVWCSGDIITIMPYEITAFEAITDAVTVVVKVPGALNDKYVVEALD